MSGILHTLTIQADGFLIAFYRITGYSLVDYFIGTMVLAFVE